MIQVDESRITINCACEWPYHRLYAEYDKEDERTPLVLAVIVGAPTFWERLKVAYKVLTAGEAWLSELYLGKDGVEALRQFLNSCATPPPSFTISSSSTAKYSNFSGTDK